MKEFIIVEISFIFDQWFSTVFVYFYEEEIANLLSKSIYLFKMSKHQAIFTFLRQRVAKSR